MGETQNTGSRQGEDVVQETAQLIAENDRANVSGIGNVIALEDLIPIADAPDEEGEKETDQPRLINLDVPDFAAFKEVPVEADDTEVKQTRALMLFRRITELCSDRIDKSSEYRGLSEDFARKSQGIFKDIEEGPCDEALSVLAEFEERFQKLDEEYPARRRAALSRAEELNETAEEREASREFVLLDFFETIKEMVAGPTVEQVISDLKLLAKGGLRGEPDIRRAQIGLLRNLTDLMKDKKFVQRELEICKTLAVTLRGDERILQARETWSEMEMEAKLAALRRIAAAQARELGLALPSIEIALQNESEKGAAGWVDPRTGTIYLVFQSEQGNKYPFDTMCDAIVHEMTHVRQRELARRYNSGELKKGDPDFTMGMIFAANLAPGMYVSGHEEGIGPYRDQPVEFHALKNGADTVRMLNVMLEKK